MKDSLGFFYGIGDKYNFNDKSESGFDGIFYSSDIDSTKTIMTEKSYKIFWMKDKTRLSFETRNVSSIKSDSGKSFWAVQEYAEGSKKFPKFYKVYNDDISEIQEFKTTWMGYTIIGLSIAAVITLFIVLANNRSNMSGCQKPSVDLFGGKQALFF